MTNENIVNAIRLEAENGKLHKMVRRQSGEIKLLNHKLSVQTINQQDYEDAEERCTALRRELNAAKRTIKSFENTVI
jgi:hypothetical protein